MSRQPRPSDTTSAKFGHEFYRIRCVLLMAAAATRAESRLDEEVEAVSASLNEAASDLAALENAVLTSLTGGAR